MASSQDSTASASKPTRELSSYKRCQVRSNQSVNHIEASANQHTTMFTTQISTMFISFTALLMFGCAFAQQYGASNGYRKGSAMKMPLMILSQAASAQPAASYKQMTMAPMMRSGGGGRGGGGGGGGGGGYGGAKGLMALLGGGGDGGYGAMPVRAAVKSSHSVDYKEVPTEPLNIQPQTILVEAQNIPLSILFQSKSSDLNLKSEHIPSKGETQETSSEDEPHILRHQVTKPIIQEVFEIITPYRKITQEIQPVKEEIQTIVARSAKDNKYEPVNSKYGSEGQRSAQSQQSSKSSYGSGGGEFAEMMNVLKMELPKSFMPVSGYAMQPAKQSRMQLYMSQLGEQNKMENLDGGMIGLIGGKNSRTESLPLIEMSEPDSKDEHSGTGGDVLDDAIGEEKEVNAGEASTQSSAQDKSLGSIMIYGAGSLTGSKATTATPKSGNGRTYLQTNYAESNTEPNGY